MVCAARLPWAVCLSWFCECIYCAPTSSYPCWHRSFSMTRGDLWGSYILSFIFEFYIFSTLYQVSSLLDASLCQLPWVQPILHLHPLQGPLPAPCHESSYQELRVPISLIRGEKAPSYLDSWGFSPGRCQHATSTPKGFIITFHLPHCKRRTLPL